MTVTTELETAPAAPSTVASRQGLTWARDFAIVGAVSAFLAPYLVLGAFIGTDVLLVTAAAGAATGAALGYGLERVLRGALQTLHWPLMALFMAGLGGLWGAAVGFAGGVTLNGGVGAGLVGGRSAHPGVSDVIVYFVACAAVAAAAQLAWFGPAYAHLRRVGGPTWPLLAAAAGTPVLGWAGLTVLLA